MEHIKLETLVDTPEFWNDPYTISQYVNSLVGSCGKLDTITVKIMSYSEQPHVTFSTTFKSGKEVPHYTIYLPKVKDFYFEEKLRSKDVKLRKAFLKHEVAHIIFSEMDSYKTHKLFESSEEFLLNNALEDVRIEHKFGQRFQGANNTFFEVQELFYKEAKSKVENNKVGVFMLALYFLYRSKKFTFEVTPQTTVYERYYQKYKNFLNISHYELSELVTNLKKEFQSEFGSSAKSKNENNKTEDNKNNGSSSSQAYGDDETSEENDEDGGSSNSGDSNSEESDSNDETQSNSTSGSSPSDSSDDNENSDTDAGKNSGGGESSDGDDEEQNDVPSGDFSKNLASEMQKNAEQENEAKEKVKSESKVENESSARHDSNGNVNVFNLQPLSNTELEKLFDLNENNDFLKYDNPSMKRHGSEVVDVSSYVSSVAKRLSFKHVDQGSNFTNSRSKPKTYQSYDRVVAKNRKNINSLVNYFKLKFQQKEKLLSSFNKEDGLLHNESLYKLFNNNFDKKVFYTVQKSLATKSEVSFLLDFSGSMQGSKVKSLVQSLIVLNEVFTRLEIPFNVFSFSGRSGNLTFYTKNKVEKNLLKVAFKNTKTFEKRDENENYVSFTPKEGLAAKEVVYCWIGKSTSAVERKNVLKLLNKSTNERTSSTEFQKNWSSVFFGGSTPEVQSVIALYNTLGPQKLFLINDGSYDRAYLNSGDRREAQELLTNKKTNLSCVRSVVNLTLGKELVFYSEPQLNFFKNEVLWVVRSFTNRGTSHYTLETVFKDSKDAENVAAYNTSSNEFTNVLSKFKDAKGKSFSVTSGAYTLTQSYNNSSDTYRVSLSVVNFKSFKLLSETYEQSVYEGSESKKVTLRFPGGVVDNVYKLLCYKVYSNYDSSTFDGSLSKNSSEEYTYKNLFHQMRNSGWSVWGIGIECWNGASYLGKENFSYVSNYSDIQKNFEKKIKSVV